MMTCSQFFQVFVAPAGALKVKVNRKWYSEWCCIWWYFSWESILGTIVLGLVYAIVLLNKL